MGAMAIQFGAIATHLSFTSTDYHFADSLKQVADTLSTDSVKADTTQVNPKEKDYAKLLKKQVSSHEGLFTVRHIEKDWYFEVPESLLGRLLLSVTRFDAVPKGFKMQTGEEVQRNVIYFEKYTDQVLFLRAYHQEFLLDKEADITSLLDKASVDPIVSRLDVVGRNPETHDMLVKVTPLFAKDTKLGGLIQTDRTQVNLGSPVADLTFVDTIRTYPINAEITTLRTYESKDASVPAARSGYVTLSLHTSIVLLPETPMQPRISDERVGYFQNRVTRFVDDEVSKDFGYISRYRLVPRDMKAYAAGRLTEPVNPIIYYIDPATPRKWVKYLKQGVEDWNVAFEAAGFRNAIQAREWPNDSTMSVDDARFSMIRYLPSSTENAYGPRIVDPRSGEIIESHICWYHNVLNLVRKWYVTQCGPLDKRAQRADLDDELMGQLIRFVSSHEVGHSLGLRHNMIASSATPVEKLRDKAWVEKHGHTASIMDYARFNYVAQPEDNVGPKGLFPRINDYDIWAIKWGYQYRPEFDDPIAESKVLRAEVTQKLRGNIRLRYCSDEGKGSDPRSQVEDLGDDGVKATDYAILNLKRVVSHLEEWTAQPDGQYDELEAFHRRCRAQFQLYANHVQRIIGGRYTNNVPDAPRYQPVPRLKQKEAIDWMGRHVFQANTWMYPSSIIEKLGVNAEDEMANRRNTLISYLLSGGMLLNQQRNNLQNPDPYPIDEYLGDVFQAVWQPFTDDERQNAYTRESENTYIDFLGRLLNVDGATKDAMTLNASHTDVRIYALQHLDFIEQYCREQRAALTDGSFNALHFDNLLLLITRIRDKYNGK